MIRNNSNSINSNSVNRDVSHRWLSLYVYSARIDRSRRYNGASKLLLKVLTDRTLCLINAKSGFQCQKTITAQQQQKKRNRIKFYTHVILYFSLYVIWNVTYTFFRWSTFASREKKNKKNRTTINARLCKSMLLHTYNHRVYGIKKNRNPTRVCERERVSERVSERGEWEWFSLCGWLIVWVSVWSGEWRTDRQIDKQIERGDREERRK